MIWVLAVLIILSDGSASGKLYYSNDKQYNTKTACDEAGRMAGQLLLSQQEDKNAKAYAFCQQMDPSDMLKYADPKKEQPQL